MSRVDRKRSIEELQTLRDSKVLVYVTSTRPGQESQMAMDAIPPIYELLIKAAPSGKIPRIDLFIHSNGGDGTVPWRLVTLIREFCDEFNVLVPNRAFSAATLTALGADHVVMHAMGMLGPTDATVSNAFNPQNPLQPNQLLGISGEDVASYIQLVKEDVGIRHEDELIQAFSMLADKVHPLALGNVKRSTLQSRMMGQKLLLRRANNSLARHDIDEIIQKLTSELYYHGHPINRQEARDDVGLAFVEDAPSEVAKKMWNLFLLYEKDMRLTEGYQPIQEAMGINPLPHPSSAAVPTAIQQASVPLPTSKFAFVESAEICYSFDVELEVNLTRDQNGAYGGTVNLTKSSWITQP